MGQFTGYAVIMLGLIVWVIYTFMMPNLTIEYTELEMISYQTIFSGIVLFPVVLFLEGFGSFAKFSSSSNMINMLILGVLITATAYLCYFTASAKIGVSKMSFMMNLIPVVSLIAGFLIYDEPISLKKIVGLSLILISIIMITDKKEKQSGDEYIGDVKIEA